MCAFLREVDLTEFDERWGSIARHSDHIVHPNAHEKVNCVSFLAGITSAPFFHRLITFQAVNMMFWNVGITCSTLRKPILFLINVFYTWTVKPYLIVDAFALVYSHGMCFECVCFCCLGRSGCLFVTNWCVWMTMSGKDYVRPWQFHSCTCFLVLRAF